VVVVGEGWGLFCGQNCRRRLNPLASVNDSASARTLALAHDDVTLMSRVLAAPVELAASIIREKNEAGDCWPEYRQGLQIPDSEKVRVGRHSRAPW
jgi:hypothetical protein